MLKKRDQILVEANFSLICRERGKLVQGTRREVHNVFTDVGRDWMAHLVAWKTLSDPDVAYTVRRVRWISFGTGTSQLEVAAVTQLETAVAYDDAGNYLAALGTSEFPSGTEKTVRFVREFSTTEISLAAAPSVALTEAGLFVDGYDISDSAFAGDDDAPFSGGEKTSLNPQVAANPPIAYARFEPVTKVQDFTLQVRWDFRF